MKLPHIDSYTQRVTPVPDHTEEAAIRTQQRRIGARLPVAGLLTTGSALAFGLLGWIAAHGISAWLLQHCHGGGAAPWRLDRHAGEAALFAGCLALGSLLALLAAPAAGRPSGPDRKRTARLSALVSVGAFLATDVTERVAAGDHPVPPFSVLLIGLAVYAAIGTGTSLLWRYCLTRVQGVSRLLDRAEPQAPQCHSTFAERTESFRPAHFAGICAGRSPPALA